MRRDASVWINWRKELEEALPNECNRLDHLTYLTTPEGKLPRDMTKEEIQENWQEVGKAKIKEISGLYDLGCFKRFPRNRSHNIIDARWVITW